jgi:hypothetical protein
LGNSLGQLGGELSYVCCSSFNGYPRWTRDGIDDQPSVGLVCSTATSGGGKGYVDGI